jgi:hypothetical protein
VGNHDRGETEPVVEVAIGAAQIVAGDRSSAPNGSSISISFGPAASARANPTRCAWPPESARGIREANSGGRATSSSNSATRASRPAAAAPLNRGTIQIFSATSMWGNRPIPWKT